MQLAVGLIPAFAIAGLFEGLVTPSDAIPEALKVFLGLAAAAVFWSYLLLGGCARNGARTRTSVSALRGVPRVRCP